jgi:hypothetical protein
MHDGVFVAHFVGSLCRPSRSNAALFDKVFDEVSDKVFPNTLLGQALITGCRNEVRLAKRRLVTARPRWNSRRQVQEGCPAPLPKSRGNNPRERLPWRRVSTSREAARQPARRVSLRANRG